MSQKIYDFADSLWFSLDNNIVTVGATEEGLNSIEVIRSIHLLDEGEEVEADQVVGDINSDDDSINIYSPVSGEVIEVNEALLENPKLIYEDPTGESWLFKIKVEDEDELLNLEKDEDSVAVESESNVDEEDDLNLDIDESEFEED